MKTAVLLACLMAGANTWASDQPCSLVDPPTVLLAVTQPDASRKQLIACGDLVRHSGGALRVNALQILQVGSERPLLSFDGTEDALLYPASHELRVVLVSRYPSGTNWKWTEVPVVEWRFTAAATAPRPRPLFPKPGVSRREIDEFLLTYDSWVQEAESSDAHFAKSEEMVGRLAVAATAGNEAAQQRFFKARTVAHLDGVAGEEYEYFWHYFTLVRPKAAPKASKPAN